MTPADRWHRAAALAAAVAFRIYAADCTCAWPAWRDAPWWNHLSTCPAAQAAAGAFVASQHGPGATIPE